MIGSLRLRAAFGVAVGIPLSVSGNDLLVGRTRPQETLSESRFRVERFSRRKESPFPRPSKENLASHTEPVCCLWGVAGGALAAG